MSLQNCLKAALCAGVMIATTAPFQGAIAAVHTITIDDLKFSRTSLEINRGDSVRFVNQDSRKHAIYSLIPTDID